MNVGPFDDEALARIGEAVSRAEARTAGEIVVYLVGECDAYPEAGWRAMVVGGLTGLAAAVLTRELTEPWGGSFLLWTLGPALLGAIVGVALSAVPAVRRRLISPESVDRRVSLRAEAAFLEEEVFATRDRTGILLFLALFEHRALVLGDSGIHRAVEAEAWEGIVDGVIAGLRGGRPVDAVIEAVGACGRLLEEHGVDVRPDDVDELANRPRVRDR